MRPCPRRWCRWRHPSYPCWYMRVRNDVLVLVAPLTTATVRHISDSSRMGAVEVFHIIFYGGA